jgi:colanic acid/amylovoran biosynthesis glycosyltransferase
MIERLPLCIVQPNRDVVSETFIRAHAERLPARVTVVHGSPARIDGKPVLSEGTFATDWRKVRRRITGNRFWKPEVDLAYAVAFRRCGARAVLAEYGPTGVQVLEACRVLGLPLIVHFHGYDASHEAVLKENADGYRRMFEQAAALVVVSAPMKEQLLSMGAPGNKLHVNVYGVDCRAFTATDPGRNLPTFLAAGRFVEKKGPHLTLLAFAEAYRRIPAIRLRMLGDGPLRPICEHMARALELDGAITFLGSQTHDVVGEEMRMARAFLQHSIRASDGDCEGTPVAILEAQASGLPVVATRHAGIPEVVLEGRTGFLVDEGDVKTMGEGIERLAEEPPLASTLGTAGRSRVLERFTMERSIDRLWGIIQRAVGRAADT